MKRSQVIELVVAIICLWVVVTSFMGVWESMRSKRAWDKERERMNAGVDEVDFHR